MSEVKLIPAIPLIPTHITRNQFVEAVGAFCQVLGINPHAMYGPLHIDDDKITFNTVVEYEPDGTPEGESVVAHPQGRVFAELACMVEIEVD